jgi:hypothetical protein
MFEAMVIKRLFEKDSREVNSLMSWELASQGAGSRLGRPLSGKERETFLENVRMWKSMHNEEDEEEILKGLNSEDFLERKDQSHLEVSTALAVARGHVRVFQTLMMLADPEKPPSRNLLLSKAADIAAVYGEIKVLEAIEELGPPPRMWEEPARIGLAGKHGEKACLEFIAAKGGNIEKHGAEAVANALTAGHFELAEWLMEQGAAPVKAAIHEQLLENLGKHGQVKILKVLASKGIDVTLGHAAAWGSLRHARAQFWELMESQECYPNNALKDWSETILGGEKREQLNQARQDALAFIEKELKKRARKLCHSLRGAGSMEI